MADPSNYTYASPMVGFENAEALPDVIQEDKSYLNRNTGVLSEAYQTFTSGVSNGRRGGFDVHIYYYQFDEEQTKFARQLWERIRHEFPELRIYRFWDKPVGPHTFAMFEVNIFTPAQFGAFIPWLVINRGPLSALIHPNTTEDPAEELRNHTQRATWMGQPLPIKTDIFKKLVEIRQAKQSSEKSQ